MADPSIYTDVRNPVYGSADLSIIVCEVLFVGQPDYLPFGAMATDAHAYGRNMYADLIAGTYGEIDAYVPST